MCHSYLCRSICIILFMFLYTNQCYADNNLRQNTQPKVERQTLETVSYPFIAKVRTFDTADISSMVNEFDAMDKRKNKQEEEEKNLVNLMIHGDEEWNMLLNYPQVSEVKLDEEWTYEIQRKAALASVSSEGYNNFKTMTTSKNKYEGISPYFNCFRNLKSSIQTMYDISMTYPHLAEVIDIGDSYLNKYDILVIKLTNQYKMPSNNVKKAKMFAMFGIHAREYSPPELGARFVEKLVTSYGLDADITTILDTTEIHIVLQANPDAREVAELYPALYRRKNMNREYGGEECEDYAFGVDLNRNFPFKWSEKGASSYPCSETYHGPYPASEPEVQAIVNYLDEIFAQDETGAFFDVHSYGRLDIWPYTYKEGAISPDNTYFVNLAQKFNAMNGHTLSGPGEPEFIGVASGASLDYAYGTVKLMAHALELGDDFYQDCDVFENDISPRNLNVLLYGAKISRDPFLMPMGPDVNSISLSSDYVTSSSTICVSASFQQNAYLESDTTLASIIVNVDSNIIDGIIVPATSLEIDTSSNKNRNGGDGITYNLLISMEVMDIGQHTLHLQGIDSIGNTGPITSIFFIVCDPNTTDDDKKCKTSQDTCR